MFTRVCVWWALPWWLRACAENGVPSPQTLTTECQLTHVTLLLLYVCWTRAASRHYAHQPPVYTPPAASYYQAPPPAYAPPTGPTYAFVPHQTFPTAPPRKHWRHSAVIFHAGYYCVNFKLISVQLILSVLWRCWLGGRKGIRPVKKLSGGVLAWLSVWSECRLAYGPADATATHCLLLQ